MGFKKTQAMNKTLLESSNEYVAFTDGDSIPLGDFPAAHNKRMQYNIRLRAW